MNNVDTVITYLFQELTVYNWFDKNDMLNEIMTPSEVYELMQEPDAEDTIMELYDSWIEGKLHRELSKKMRYGKDFECCGVNFIWYDSWRP